MKKKIFITGINGFIGKYLASRLSDDYELTGLVQEKELENEEIGLYAGDLRDFSRIKEILHKVQPNFIIHLAARTEVEKSFYDPSDFSGVNYVGTVNMIEAAKDLENLELFVFSSTMETYGAVPKDQWHPFTEETKQEPNAPYAVAKLACEYYLKYAQRAYNFPFAALRQTNSYGRHDNDFFVVEQFITQMLKNPHEANFGYREPYRNFLYIDDLIDLYVKLLKNVDLVKGEFFVTGPNNAIQIEELADMIAKKLNWAGEIKWGTKPERKGEIYYLNSNPEKAKRILNWQPKVSLSEGLDKTIAIWKNNLNLQ